MCVPECLIQVWKQHHESQFILKTSDSGKQVHGLSLSLGCKVVRPVPGLVQRLQSQPQGRVYR